MLTCMEVNVSILGKRPLTVDHPGLFLCLLGEKRPVRQDTEEIDEVLLQLKKAEEVYWFSSRWSQLCSTSGPCTMG